MGPLLGSFAQGYTTPPPPNALNQAVGIATSLAGLGTSLFGKRGGVVGRKVGGLVPVPRMRFAGAVPMVRRAGGFVPVFRTGGLVIPLRFGGPVPRRFLSGGMLSDGTVVGSDDDDQDQQQQPAHSTGFNIGQLKLPKQNLPDPNTLMRQQMRQAKQKQQPQQDDSLAGTIKGVAGLAKAAIPLFSLLERGGTVKRYQDAGNVDDDEEDTDDTDTTDDTDDDQAVIPAAAQVTAGQTAALPPTAGPAGPSLPWMGTPGATSLTPATTAPAARDTGAPTAVADRSGRPTVQTIPGLGARPRGFLERWATNPLTAAGAAMLSSRSPYFGAGLGAGINAAAGAVEYQRKQELLDAKPQMLPDGSWRIGNKVINMGLKSKSQLNAETKEAAAMRMEDKKQKNRLEILERKGQGGSRASQAQEEATRRSHAVNLERGLRAIGDDPAQARAYIEQYNQRHGTTFQVPELPTKEEKKAGTSSGWWSNLWKSLTGSSEPAAAAPATPAAPTTPAAPATAAPAPAPASPAPAAPAAPAPAASTPAAPTAQLPSGTSPEQAKEQARVALGKVGNDPAKRQAIFDRLKQWKIDFSDLISQSAPAAPQR
jgi:hypothetical protein